jgi:hypothetical protein
LGGIEYYVNTFRAAVHHHSMYCETLLVVDTAIAILPLDTQHVQVKDQQDLYDLLKLMNEDSQIVTIEGRRS